MVDDIISKEGLLDSVRGFIIHTRKETPQERADFQDSLWNQMEKERRGSEKYDTIFMAFRAFRRLPERSRLVIFNNIEIPIWF